MCARRQLIILLGGMCCFLGTFASNHGIPEGRIIGGKETDIARHPYIASIRYRIEGALGYYHECAGAVYSAHVIITGAQCVRRINRGDRVMVVVGAKTRNGVDGMLHPATKWVYHPNFDYYSVDFDIGLIFVEVPFDLAYFEVQPIAIRASRPATNRNALVAGWGYREEWGPSSIELEEVDVPIVSNEDCNKIYGAGEVTERMICAGDLKNGGRDACQGDTGGPLVIDGQLVGLVSWGRGCGRIGYPSVYTYVPSLKDWVDETIAANL